jgi:hypothetical protein
MASCFVHIYIHASFKDSLWMGSNEISLSFSGSINQCKAKRMIIRNEYCSLSFPSCEGKKEIEWEKMEVKKDNLYC